MTLQQRIREILQQTADKSSPVATLKGVPNQLVKPEHIDQALSEINKAVLEYKEVYTYIKHQTHDTTQFGVLEAIPAELFEEQVNE